MSNGAADGNGPGSRPRASPPPSRRGAAPRRHGRQNASRQTRCLSEAEARTATAGAAHEQARRLSEATVAESALVNGSGPGASEEFREPSRQGRGCDSARTRTPSAAAQDRRPIAGAARSGARPTGASRQRAPAGRCRRSRERGSCRRTSGPQRQPQHIASPGAATKVAKAVRSARSSRATVVDAAVGDGTGSAAAKSRKVGARKSPGRASSCRSVACST